MARRVLHILSQRPQLTGSGITVDALIRYGTDAGWHQHAVVGTPADDPRPQVGGLASEQIHPLVFDRDRLNFALPGMSDVMPYRSSRFSQLTSSQLRAYRDSWRHHLREVIGGFEPALIHTHHVWLVSALLKSLAPHIPVVNHCHATGLRQLALCPHLADEVKQGCANNDRFVVLHRGHARELSRALGCPLERIEVVGAGYRQELFNLDGRAGIAEPTLLYVGKLSDAKGLPCLLTAVERMRQGLSGLVLHVAGSGAGPRARVLTERMRAMRPTVQIHGQLSQIQLAALMKRSHVLVLPSFYEGVPLVLVEALACGCRLVSTELPGVVEQIAPYAGRALTMVALPRLVGTDEPLAGDLPAFVDELVVALERALALGDLREQFVSHPLDLGPFTWGTVFGRVQAVWCQLLAETPQ